MLKSNFKKSITTLLILVSLSCVSSFITTTNVAALTLQSSYYDCLR